MSSLYGAGKTPANGHFFERWASIRLPAPIVYRYYYSEYDTNRITVIYTLHVENPFTNYIPDSLPVDYTTHMPVREQARMHRAYKAVDTFCGAGGCSTGYWIAGFDVVGIDQDPSLNRRYPYQFVQQDAINYYQILLASSDPSTDENLPTELRFVPAFIHASPPCQIYSTINNFPSASNRVDLVDITRDHLLALQEKYPDLCWIIENVAGAPLIDPVELCGATFGLKTYRHRFFELSHRDIAEFIIDTQPPHIPHIRPQAGLGRRPQPFEFMSVVGGLADVGAARIAMGIDWMSGPELAQAIPPAYTAFLGSYMRKHLDQLNKGKPLFTTT